MAGLAPIAGGHAHPAGLGFTLVVGAAAMGQPMGEGDVLIGHDVHVAEVEFMRALAHFHAFQPMRAVSGLAAKLQGLDRVVGDKVVGIQ